MYAQLSLRSGLNGVVTDPVGASVPDAQVKLVDIGRNQTQTVKTSETGAYSFLNLLSGQYRVEVEARGFKRTVSAEVALG